MTIILHIFMSFWLEIVYHGNGYVKIPI